MKYLLIRPAKYSLGNYDVLKFETAEELTAHVESHGAKDAIVAQRIGLKLAICDWQPPQVEQDDF